MTENGLEEPSRAPKPSGGARILVPVALALVAILAIVLIAALGLFAWMLVDGSRAPSSSGAPVQIEIKRGSSTATIAQQLEQAGVIDNVRLFRLRSRLSGSDGRLRAGIYDLTTGMADADVIERLRTGPTVRYVSVTIPEGYVVDQIAERFEAQAGVPAGEFKSLAKGQAGTFADKRPYLADAYQGSLEGYLFPKTYRVKVGSSARQVIEVMLTQFDTEMATVDLQQAQARGLTLGQLVTVASMIEKEGKLDTERPLIASVIYNRLDRDMLLKIDATIQYVLGSNKFRLENRDLRLKTPYNTYLHKGLPPGPISNPGLKSLQAAAAPAQTALLYYVLTGKDGSHTFTTNMADFLAAKKKSKEIFGK